MNDERRTTGSSPAGDGIEPSLSSGPAADASSLQTANDHNVVALAFRERPYYDQMLMKTHPSKVYFDAFMLHPVPGGFVPVLVSSVLVDKALRH